MLTAIALNRFGLGARPDEDAPADPKAWLIAQFDRYEPRPAAWAALPGTAEIARNLVQERKDIRAAGDADAKLMARKRMHRNFRDIYRRAVNARTACALVTPAPFVERLVYFWANHFAVSVDKGAVKPFAGAFEAEAIRPHVLGRFEDMLLAAERHIAMQLYLDQAQSIGPDSRFAMRVALRHPGKKRGLNENLAREAMELHTIGVRTGYTQADVTEFARALTGWSIGGLGRAANGDRVPPGGFVFRPALHEPGVRRIMGKAYFQQGEAQALAVFHDLARSEATARHIATKLARHFVADDPPPTLVERLAEAFSHSGGHLPTVYRALVAAPESWAPGTPKFKTPWEWLISALRGIGMRRVDNLRAEPILQQLGEPIWRPGSPAGYDDIAASWAAPDALLRRVEFAGRLSARIGDRVDARARAEKLLPGVVSRHTRSAIAHADSAATALALLLVAPEFQRR